MGLGDRADKNNVRSVCGARHQRVDLRPSKRGEWRPLFVFLFWFGILGGLVAAIVMMVRRDDKDEPRAAVEELAVPPTEPQEPTITMTEVSAGVYHLDFGGDLCDTPQCLKRASGLVLERVPDHRIVSIAPIGGYGSPSALSIVTVPVPY